MLKAGQSFYEPAGYAHAVANKGSETARVSVSYLIPKGAQVITMVK
jgi:quercetin dioxygenase-like cupin family protein